MARSKSKIATTPEATPPAAAEPPKKRRGPKEFTPTAEHRRNVEVLAGLGLTHEEICLLIVSPRTGRPVDRETLAKHFRAELDRGVVAVHAAAGRSLMMLIQGRPAQYDAAGNKLRDEVPINPAAVMFYHKTRRGWRETDRLELTGANGSAIKTEDVTKRARETLTRRIAGVATRLGANGEAETTH